ncbi:MAG: hypothetical protein ACRD09_06015 [Vicinamibacterales bacterium]
MTKLRCVFCALAAATLFFLSASIARAEELQLIIANGRVTLVADSVPIRTILTEWSRIGQTKIVNGEKLTGGPITLMLLNVPEAQALDILLRSASGYMAAPRAAGNAGASQFDRVVILASSRPTTTGPAPANNNFQNVNPRFQAPPPMVQPVEGDQDEEVDEEATPNRVLPPGFQTQPGMPVQVPPGTLGMVPSPGQPAQLPQQPPPGQVLAPITSPRPGPVPVPPQPAQNPNKPIPL